jgi:type IV pilus assembly protein PilY1
MKIHSAAHTMRQIFIALWLVLLAVAAGPGRSAATPTTSVAQIPLTIAVPAHPQIVIALGNSESMDGNLSGAIMLGSGSLNASMASLQSSSSPLTYSIPAGFTPPVDPGAAGSAPYTVAVGGQLVDNSPSRLNVAKQGIAAMLTSFMPNADFALLDYQTGGATLYTTWLYQMSPTGSAFVFTNAPAATNRYAQNPCYNYPALPFTNVVFQNCLLMDISGKVIGSMATSQFMQISASSDDPLINDVLYAGGGIAPACLVYGGPSPANPYPPNYTLGTYNSNPGNVSESYSRAINGCATTTTPTNAGFVPYTPQTMYIQRGFGYGASQSATAATTLAPMTSAGQYPTSATVNAAIANFTSYLAPETNAPGSGEVKASAGQSALPGLLKGAHKYYTTKNPPSSNGCTASRYVVLLTDGLPTLDLSGDSWPPPGTTSATAYGMTVTFNADGSLNAGATNDQAVVDTINQLAALNAAGIKTYVIGLGAGVDPTQNPVAAQVLTAMAIAGGTGSYFAALSPTALTNDLQVILAKILAATQSTASTAVNTTGLHNGSVAYLAQFTTSDTNQDWTGDLGAYPIDPVTAQVNTAPTSALWSASAKLDAQDWDTGRLIATWDPVSAAGTPVRWTPSLAPGGISATTALGMSLSTFTPDPSGQNVLEFLRGNNAREVRFGGQFRTRTHKLGDIVDSAPLYVGKPAGFTQAAAYFSFASSHANRTPIIYIGADDGMLHAFDATTGVERFAYVPNGVFANLVKLANPYYNQNHLFYVNASPQAADVQFSDSTWHTLLVGTEGAGGRTLFGLDVTDPDAITTEVKLAQAVLWETTDTDMGLTLSAPAFAVTANGWKVLVGNGYNSPSQKPVLYALDPATGAISAKVDLCAAVASACNTSLANGLSSATAINSYGQVSAPADTIYAGDLQGNLWRIDITNSNPLLWTVKVIYQARDAGGNIQPITTAPAVTLNPHFPAMMGTMVMVGTGQLLGFGDLTSTATQTLYGIFDPPTIAGPPLGFSGIPARGNLVQQTMSASTVGAVSVRIETAVNAVTLPAKRGWYVDFTLAAGERMVTDPRIETGGGVVLTTYQPNTNSCLGGGNAWLMVFNYATGGSFPLPELDLNNDGKLNTSDAAAGKNPIGEYLGNVFASAATIIPSGGGNTDNGAHKLTAVSNVQVKSVGDRGGSKQRISWWEVRH